MYNSVFIVILAIIFIDYLLERYLDYLNAKRFDATIPRELEGVYDEAKYRQSQNYNKVNHTFGMITSSFSFVLIVLMLFLSGFAFVDSLVEGFTSNTILTALIFFGIIGLASDLLGTPFDVYDTFVIEQKFGFNKSTPQLFVVDKLKGWLLAALLGGGVMAFIIWLWEKTGSYFWLIAWGTITFLSVFMTMFYSNIIVPIFNKQKPLDDGELKDAINKFAGKAGFTIKNIFVIDGSKRSTKANAYFTGIGPKKRIVLYDTLINDLTTSEIVAVLAHEIGHYKKKHVLSSLLIGIAETGVMLFLFSWLVSNPALSQALGVDVPKFHIGLIAFGVLYSPLSFLLGIGMNLLSRKNEYQADAFAASFGLSNELVSALKKLSVNNLSNLTPHPLYVFFHYSHPTLLQRILKLKQNER
jgi:STE24 endopeptidase